MKNLFKVLLIIVSSIIMILSLAFIFIEGRLLFSGDWIVYDNPFNGMIRYLCRLLLSIFAFIKSLLEIIYINKEHKMKEYLWYTDISLIVISIIVLLFSTNFVGLVCIVLATINFVIKLIICRLNTKQISKETLA